MPDPTQILLTADSASAVAGINATAQSAQRLAREIPTTGSAMHKLGEQVDTAGRQARIGLQSLGDVSNLVGFNKNVGESIGQAAMLTDAVGDLSGVFTALNPALLAVTVIGGGLALVLGHMRAESEAAAKAAAEALVPYEKLAQSLRDLDKISPAIAQSMREQLNLTKEQAIAMADLASKSESYRALVESRNQADIAMVTIGQQLAAAKKEQASVEAILLHDTDAAIAPNSALNMKLAEQKALVETLTQKLTELTGARKDDIDAMAAWAAKMAGNVTPEQHKARMETATLNALWEKQKTDAEEAAKASEKYASALQSVAKAQEGIFKGMVEKALSPTAVTDTEQKRMDIQKRLGDIQKQIADAGPGRQRQLESETDALKKQLAALGPYSDKWDEFRRRAEAVFKGTDPMQYGAQFAGMLKGLGMPLQQVVDKFKDFSLFADPKNMKLIDWGAFTADIGQQLLSLVGKANVMKEGFAKAWGSLSADQRRALRELGIESAGDAKKVLAGTANNLTDPFFDKDVVAKYKAAGASAVTTIGAGAVDKESLAKWGQVPRTLADNLAGYFSLKETVEQLNNAGKAMIEAIAAGVRNNSSVLSGAVVDATMQAIQAAIDAAGGAGPSGGGAGRPSTPASTQMGPAFGGSSVQLVYAPAVSLATKGEVETVLAPLLRNAQRINTRRGG